MKTAIVTGHTSGLGALIRTQLIANGYSVVGLSRDGFTPCDLTDAESITHWVVEHFPEEEPRKVDLLVNCAGENRINWFEDLAEVDWDDIVGVNAKAIFTLSNLLIRLGKFNTPATILNIVSNASHMPMTHSAVYNASKGAAHILTLQMARELRKRHGLTVFGISPNKLKGTGMSNYIDERVCELRGWTKEEAASYQLNSLPAGEETDPAALAEFIGFLLSSRERHKFLHGCILPYGA
jgi:NAD(P)-dependent dehydrogenase (short-subunit alcohol dehydrogenase family)